MSMRTQRDFLKIQLLEIQRVKELVADHPIMSISFREQEQAIIEQLAVLPIVAKEAKVILLFSGDPVHGSLGIDAIFTAHVLEPFQNMVMADYADRWHGVVGSRGRHRGEEVSRLLLTGLPHGSFGLELSRANTTNDDLFEEDQLADTLSHITKLVESSGKSDEDFSTELDQTAPRVIQNLKQFLEIIMKGKSGLTLVSGNFRCSMNQHQLSEAFNRVAGTTTNDEIVELSGILKGVLLESWKFDFLTDDKVRIAGKIDDDLIEDEVIAMNTNFFNNRCLATILKTTVLFKNGRVRTTHILKKIAAVVDQRVGTTV
ncbi:conserved hypothetical protein [Gammaproteobacteria bacterium]